MFGKGNAMVSTVSILLVIMFTIGANPAYIGTSSSIVNPGSAHSRKNFNEKPLPEQKNVSVKMSQSQSNPLEKQGHTRFKSIIGWQLLLPPNYFHTNVINSVTAITGANGNLVERISYDLFGIPMSTNAVGEVVSKSTIGNTLLFHGRRYDAETNLYYFRARYYDPIIGQFLQKDPMGYVDSMNLYQGFNMNPVIFIDTYVHALYYMLQMGYLRKGYSYAEARQKGLELLIERGVIDDDPMYQIKLVMNQKFIILMLSGNI